MAVAVTAAVVYTRADSSMRVAFASDLPASAEPAFRVPLPVRLRDRGVALWAGVRRGVAARTAPRADAPVVARLTRRSPEDTAGIVVVLGRARDDAGRLWVRVRLAVLPNGTTGWVPRSALAGYNAVDTRLVVDVRALTATLFRDGRVIFRADVGVGRAEWPTPTGEFFVRSKMTEYSSRFYGPVAFGTSARSSVLTDWPAGGFVGIHGTNRPELIPGRVSHGCIRMRNDDILELARLMPVGTPLTIR